MAISKVDYGNRNLIDLTNDTISEDKLFLGETAHKANGEVVAGSFTIDSELSTQNSLISQIQSALEGKAAGSGSGSGSTSFETCTIVINWEREDYNMLDMKFGMMTLNNQGELSPNIQGEIFDADPNSPYYLATKTFENVVCGTMFVIWYQTYNGEYADAWQAADPTYRVEATMFVDGFVTAFATPPTQGTYTVSIL